MKPVLIRWTAEELRPSRRTPPGHDHFQDGDGIGPRVVAESKGIGSLTITQRLMQDLPNQSDR